MRRSRVRKNRQAEKWDRVMRSTKNVDKRDLFNFFESQRKEGEGDSRINSLFDANFETDRKKGG